MLLTSSPRAPYFRRPRPLSVRQQNTAFDDLDSSLEGDLLKLTTSRITPLKSIRISHGPSAPRSIARTSGRSNFEIGAHAYHIEVVNAEQSGALLNLLFDHAEQERYMVATAWQCVGDTVTWDETVDYAERYGMVFEGKCVRNVTRTTVHDLRTRVLGLNRHSEKRQDLPELL